MKKDETISIKNTTESSSNMENKLSYTKLFYLFMIGCVFGVLMEGFFCLIVKGRWESHVVSIWGPFNILYGAGAVVFYVGAVKLREKNIVLKTLIMMVVATILELLCGLLLKNVLGMRAWNYSKSFMNYQGLICLKFSLGWGLAALLFCVAYPKINKMLNFIDGKVYKIICYIITVFMIFNVGLASASIARWSERHYGVPATNQIQRVLDYLAPDEWMENRFIEWKFLN